MVTLISCGLNHDEPPYGELEFDCLVLPDPSPVVQDLPGTDPVVAEVIAAMNPLFDSWVAMAADYVHLAAQRLDDIAAVFYCAAGHHRSVAAVERVAAILQDYGTEPTIVHRDLEGGGL